MAKMALNGYEIGIQRKIKPADHIQSMADKIQDTVVTKHPLNADGSSSGENSRDNTLKHPLNKPFEKGYKTQDSIQTLGDKIKETIINNHPMTVNFTNSNVPVPPPIPKSPIPTFNAHSTPIAPPMNMNINNNIKQSEYIPKNLNNSFAFDAHNNSEKSLNGSGYSSSEDFNKDKTESSNVLSNTLRKKTGFEKTSFLNGMNSYNNDTYKPEIKLDSNTLNKKKMFENREAVNGGNNYADKINKFNDKNNVTDLNISTKNNTFEKSMNEGNTKTTLADDDYAQKPSLPHNMYDNTLYTFKTRNDNNSIMSSNDSVNSKTEKRSETGSTDGSEKQEDNESEVVVKRRQKKNTRNDDGRRDSHIIARPLSTMTSVDVTDGMYPVCHKCDKAITR